MTWTRKLTLGVALLFLAAPVGTVLASHGTWQAGGGAYEPSTTYDTPAFMFDAPNQAAVEKVYFNGYLIHDAGVFLVSAAKVDGNLDGGNMAGVLGNYFVALLGFWRDCNKDGYIGARMTPSSYGSFASYPSAQPEITGKVDTSICPVGSPYYPVNPATGHANGFVTEFRHIGPGAGCDSYEAGCPGTPTEKTTLCVPLNCNGALVKLDRYTDAQAVADVTDNDSRVWADWERPGGPHVRYGFLAPLPRGTFETSGGTLQFVDDATLNTLSTTPLANAVYNAVPKDFGDCPQPHPVFLGGSSHTCGLYPLWQARRIVNDTTCTSAGSADGKKYPGCWEPDPLVTTWDLDDDDDGDGNPCNDGVSQNVDHPTSPSQYLLRFGLPDLVIGVNPNFLADGSLSGTLKHQQRALDHNVPFTSMSNEGGCGKTGGIEDQTEVDAPASQSKHVEPSNLLNFSSEKKMNALAAQGYYNVPYNELRNGGGGPAGVLFGTSGWYSGVLWTSRPPRTAWGATAPTYTTFYADVSPQAFAMNTLANPATALPAGAQDAHMYGSDFCKAFTTGPENIDPDTRWDCSITQWQLAKLVYPISAEERYGPIIGDKYDLRDVDCYANEVSQDSKKFWGDLLAGIHVGIVDCSAVH